MTDDKIQIDRTTPISTTIIIAKSISHALVGPKSFTGNLFGRIPLIKSVYKPVAQVVRLFSGDEAKEVKAMQVVMCTFGDGASVLALLTTADTYLINDIPQQLVYLPTSPLPMSGGLVFVPESKVRIVKSLSVDDLMKIYFSLGALAPEIAKPSFSDPA